MSLWDNLTEFAGNVTKILTGKPVPDWGAYGKPPPVISKMLEPGGSAPAAPAPDGPVASTTAPVPGGSVPAAPASDGPVASAASASAPGPGVPAPSAGAGGGGAEGGARRGQKRGSEDEVKECSGNVYDPLLHDPLHRGHREKRANLEEGELVDRVVVRDPTAARNSIVVDVPEKGRRRFFNVNDTFDYEPFSPSTKFLVANANRLYSWGASMHYSTSFSAILPNMRHTSVNDFLENQYMRSESPDTEGRTVTVGAEYGNRIQMFATRFVELIAQNRLRELKPKLKVVRKTVLVRHFREFLIRNDDEIRDGDVVLLPLGVPFYTTFNFSSTAAERTFKIPSMVFLKIDEQEADRTDLETIRAFLANGRVSLYHPVSTENNEGLLCEILVLKVCDDTPPRGAASSFGSFRKKYIQKHPNASEKYIHAKYIKARALFG